MRIPSLITVSVLVVCLHFICSAADVVANGVTRGFVYTTPMDRDTHETDTSLTIDSYSAVMRPPPSKAGGDRVRGDGSIDEVTGSGIHDNSEGGTSMRDAERVERFRRYITYYVHERL